MKPEIELIKLVIYKMDWDGNLVKPGIRARVQVFLMLIIIWDEKWDKN